MHMETKKFQENLVEDIKRGLAKKEVKLARLQELAKAALALDDRFPEGVPEAEARRLLNDYDELTENSKQALRREKGAADEQAIGQIRKTLGLEDKK